MIGYAMLYTIVVSMPLVAAAMFVAHFLQTHGRAERVVWVVAIALTLVVPAVMLSRPVQAPADAWLPPIQVELVTVPALPGPAEVAAAESSSAPSSRSAPVDLDALLLGAWILVSLVLAARWTASAVRLNRLSQSWLTDTVEGMQVWLAPELGPAVTGVLRPRVVVPAWVPALSGEQRALVLLHEQEHVRARDPWLMTLARLTRIITPWNPATWLLSSRLKRAVELDCDRRVLRRHPSVEAYGATLLAVSARGSNRLLSAAAFAESDVPLRKRILAMTTPPRAVSAIGVLITVAVGSTLVSSAIAVPVPAMRVLPAPAGVLPAVMAEVPRTASADPAAQQVRLPQPRVIADPRPGWREVYSATRSDLPTSAVVSAPPGAGVFILGDSVRWIGRFPPRTPWDSIQAILGDSARFVILPAPWSPSDRPPPTSSPPRVVNEDDVIRAIADAYPTDLRDRGLGGTVGMHFLVSASGTVEAIRVGQISAYPALDEAARRVAEVYRFSPALRDGEPVTVWIAHAISFQPTR